MMSLTICVLVLAALGYVEPHGMVLVPKARNIGVPWNENGLWCGNVPNLPHVPLSTCGVCGDAPTGPQDNKLGGLYGTGIVQANYTGGSLIDISISITAPHWGYYEMDLCDSDDESYDCFKAHPLKFANGNYRMDVATVTPYISNEQVHLPEGVTCERCTLRWTYRTAYTGPPNWNPRYDPNPAQTFRNCVDIGIL